MNRKVLGKSFPYEDEAEEKETQRKDPSGFVPWSNPIELQAKGRNTTQGPDTSGTGPVVSSARHQDTSHRAEPLSRPRRHPPVFIDETLPGAILVPGMGDDGLTIEERYDDDQATIASNEASTVQVMGRAVDTEEERRMLRELDQLRQLQIRHERDQLRQMLDNAPTITPVVATNGEEKNGDQNTHGKCGSKGRRWFAVSAILLIVGAVAVAVTLALVLPSEPTPPQVSLTELISSASSDGGAALADPTTPQNRALEWLAGNPNLANYTDLEKIQRYALATLYFSTNGDDWDENYDWLSNKGVCHNWYGNSMEDDTTMDCTSDGGVSSLDLVVNNLQGSIPPEIGMLSDSLQTFELYGHDFLEGTLPTEIGELTKLTYLSLTSNALTGTIPNELGLLTTLVYLDLGANRFTSTIPNELGLLTMLTYLGLFTNQMTGTLPKELGQLTKLTYLGLFSNQWTSTIPNELGLLTMLSMLSLGQNQLTGTLLTSLVSLKLERLFFNDNELTGKIPMELGLLTKLTLLDLSVNHLTGTVPTSLASLPRLSELEFYDNALSGSLNAFCGINFEYFVANTCGQDKMNCTCCTHCWNSVSDSMDEI